MAASTRVRIVSIGLEPYWHGNPVELRPLFAKRLQAVQEQVTSVGYDHEIYFITPEEDVATLGPKLQSRRPDGVIIGNGVRGRMELTHFMEQIIDTVRTSAPQAKLMFNINPESTLDAMQRWFPSPIKSA